MDEFNYLVLLGTRVSLYLRLNGTFAVYMTPKFVDRTYSLRPLLLTLGVLFVRYALTE